MSKRISAYLEQQILSSSPLELVALYYQFSIDAVREAREELVKKDIRARVRAIARAQALIVELHRALNVEAGDGKLAKELSRLYHYAMRRLLEASQKEDDAPLNEVLGLLSTLGEAWDETARASAMETPSSYSISPWECLDAEAPSHRSFSY